MVYQKRRVGSAAVLAASLMLAAGTARAQSPSLSPKSPQYYEVGPPTHLEVDGQMYPASLGGLREYVNTLRTDDPVLFRKLDGRISRLETHQEIATASLAGGIFVFVIGAGAGLWLSHACDDSSPDNTCGDYMTYGFGIGLLGGLAGVLTYASLAPGGGDVRRLINLHNRLNPQRRLEFRVGLNGQRRMLSARLQLRFDPAF